LHQFARTAACPLVSRFGRTAAAFMPIRPPALSISGPWIDRAMPALAGTTQGRRSSARPRNRPRGQSAIGATNAVLVALFFMHLVRSPGRTWLAAGLGLFWLSILIALTMTDYLARKGASF
jgi:hypothetical protein